MKRNLLRTLCSAFFALTALLVSIGCAATAGKNENTAVMEEARQKITSGMAECVLIQSGRIVYQEKGKGVSPLLNLYKTKGAEMKGGIIVDKVIGRAAAAIAICGKASHVHGEVMSEDAVEFLQAHNITSSSTLMVKRILNQKRSGLCPLERSVEGISDPHKALTALEKRIEQFRKQALQRKKRAVQSRKQAVKKQAVKKQAVKKQTVKSRKQSVQSRNTQKQNAKKARNKKVK